MAAIEEKEVIQLVNQISELKSAIENKGSDERIKLGTIPIDKECGVVRSAADGMYISGSWEKFPDEKTRTEIHQRLIQCRDSLYSALGQDGPREPNHIMYFEYAPTSFIILWGLIGAFLISFLLIQIIERWDIATDSDYHTMINNAWSSLETFTRIEDELKKVKSDTDTKLLQATRETDKDKRESLEKAAKDRLQSSELQRNKELTDAFQKLTVLKERKHDGATEGKVIEMVALLGALGGSIHFLGSIVNYTGTRRLRRSWLLYYLSLPFIGATMAPIVYMLLRVGILAPTGQANGGTAISNLNLITIYAFSALTGMFAKTATEKLGDVFAAIFQPKPERVAGDKVTPEKDSGSSGTGSGKGP